MQFRYEKGANLARGALFYIADEKSLSYLPSQKNDYSLVLGRTYCTLDILSETKEVIQIGGFNPIEHWKKRRLQYPQSSPGRLYVHTEGELLPGAGNNYGLNWQTYFDPSANAICMGEDTDTGGCECITFRKGLVAVLREHALIAIWGQVTFYFRDFKKRIPGIYKRAIKCYMQLSEYGRTYATNWRKSNLLL